MFKAILGILKAVATAVANAVILVVKLLYGILKFLRLRLLALYVLVCAVLSIFFPVFGAGIVYFWVGFALCCVLTVGSWVFAFRRKIAARPRTVKEAREESQPPPAQQPAPQSYQQPAPQPAPSPDQQPAPQPAPSPYQQPAPQPAPQSYQQPAPQPYQQPAPQPAPSPYQQPVPQPAPSPYQQPAPPPRERYPKYFDVEGAPQYFFAEYADRYVLYRRDEEGAVYIRTDYKQ